MKEYFSLAVAFLALLMTEAVTGQGTVPAGIHYQAVARDKYDKEVINTDIEVQFSIRTVSPVGTIVYREVHNNVTTSKYGVFSLIVGKGTRVDGTAFSFADIDWSTANHWLQVEVKFVNDWLDMGTLQFMAVPYALYAGKSLEPGPQGPIGPQGPPGPEASDDQTLSVINVSGIDYLSIIRGNSVPLSQIEKDGDPTNELQDLVYDAVNRRLSLLKSTAPAIDLSELKNDADASPTNEIQTITYTTDNHQLTLSNGGGTQTIDPLIAFRAGFLLTSVTLPDNPDTEVPITFDQSTGNNFNDGGNYSYATGVFTPPFNGIYTFNVSLRLPANISVILKVSGKDDERIINSFSSTPDRYTGSVTMKLSPSNTVKVILKNKNGFGLTSSIEGYFSGFRVY